jgi:FixJ family two-component response regulator
LKPSLIHAVRRLRKEGFLAFIDAPVDVAVLFALVRSAVDCQVEPSLNGDLKPGLTGTALQLAIG